MNPALLNNVSTFPKSIQPLITEFSQKLIERFSGDIISVLVYGSAAGADYKPGVSNINFAVILKSFDFSVLKNSLDVVKWGHRRKINTPLFLTKTYILNALDVFPIEFSDIKEQHKLIYGEDLFKDLSIPLTDIRLLCEQQVKGKLLHLRQAYLDIGSNPALLKKWLGNALKDLFPVFRQLIMLKIEKPVESKEEVLNSLARMYALDPEALLAVYQDRIKGNVISSHQVESYFQNFLIQLEKLSSHLDSL